MKQSNCYGLATGCCKLYILSVGFRKPVSVEKHCFSLFPASVTTRHRFLGLISAIKCNW